MRINSPMFRNGERIPHQYSRYGSDKIPPLQIDNVPSTAKSLVLIMDDPDAPSGLFTHWIVFDLDPKTTEIPEDHAPRNARQGTNSWGEAHYGGPRPPSGEHRYYFHLYAMDRKLELPGGATRVEVEQAMEGHVVDKAETMGRFAAPAAHPAGAAH